MQNRVGYFLNRLGERLWLKPLVMGLLSVGAAFVAKAVDLMSWAQGLPTVTVDSVETLLKAMSASMLVIAALSVASMVSAYASASNTATPRTFTLVVADDVSQNALSTFVGSFIFSIVSLIALQNSYYGDSGRFILFVLTLVVFALVIAVFVRWVDRIARLGRVVSTIEKVENATAKAMRGVRSAPTLRARPIAEHSVSGDVVYSSVIGYVQEVDVEELQACAERGDLQVAVAALPGTFAAPGVALAHVYSEFGTTPESEHPSIQKAFLIGDERVYESDPRFGLVVLAEVASRALSAGVNDPGTAIDVIGRLVRLFSLWNEPVADAMQKPCKYDRVEVPEPELADMFDDVFTPIGRDGAGSVEVVVRTLKALEALAAVGDERMRELAMRHAQLVLSRAEIAMVLDDDRRSARHAARFAASDVERCASAGASQPE